MFRVLSVLFALSFGTLAHAQCAGPSFMDDLTEAQRSDLTEFAIATPYGTGNFWQATRGNTTLTIAGTMHLPDPRHGAFLDITLPRLARADLLLVEATLDDQRDMQIHMSRNTDMMMLPDGASLRDLVAPDTWDAVVDAASTHGIPAVMAARMQPWFLSMSLAIPPCAMLAMASGDGGLDNELMTRAQVLGVPVAPLEPWEDMLDLLASGTLEEQVDALRVALIAPDMQAKMMVAMLDLYFAEQSAMAWQMATYAKDFLPPDAAAVFDDQMAELEAELLTKRNANWIPVIEDAAATHDEIFLGFGAAHLFGEDGVLNLLAERGWTITPI